MAVNQKLVLAMLERMGYRADVAGNGLEALEALQRQPYDVVLMDVQMPDMDGLEAARRIRRDWLGEDRPRLIALTANALQEDQAHCREAGMDDYLAKPVKGRQLQEALLRSGRRADERRPAGGRVEAGRTVPSLPDRPAPTGNDILDVGTLTDLREAMGAELVRELSDLFRADAPALLATMATAAAEGNASQIEMSAHRLRGAAATLGAKALATACARLEDRGRAGTVQGVGPLLAEAERQFDRTVAVLDTAVASAEGGPGVP